MTTYTLQLPLHGLRSRILLWGYTHTYPLYAKIRRYPRPAWQISTTELLRMSPESLGYQLGQFLQSNGLQLMPGFEHHDVAHVLFEFGTTAPEEVALQWALLGNGKRRLYCVLAAFTGALLFPEHWGYLRRAFQKGRQMRRCYHWYFEYLLRENRAELLAFLNYQKTENYVSNY